LVYQIGTLITTGSFGVGFLPGLIGVGVIAAVIVWLCLNADKKLKQESAVTGRK
jgi:ferrous iron transport protein B